MDRSQAYLNEAEDYHDQQTRIAKHTDADETIPIEKVVDDAKKDWD
ncbi:MAG: hypothetical protein V3T17_18125 [Pseudomonadales bacterium]